MNWRKQTMTDLDFPGCGAADEYGHPIMCEDCIWGETCIDSTVREDNDGTEEL
uniref:Uncharacterized protein n=1 Tax=Siphoviridae sp. ctM6i4 TaxID=2827852 RepID=A0A8S5T3D0_9CAUD|nr:MAG TPA: hypothetical protein [Siphoviridae sp. ctM6i4]